MVNRKSDGYYMAVCRYDVKNIFYQQKKVLGIFALFLALLICIEYRNLMGWFQLEGVSNPGALECFVYFFSGVPEFYKEEEVKFELPVVWMYLHFFVIYYVGNYLTKDENSLQMQIRIRTGKASSLICGKAVFLAVSILLLLGIFFLILCLVSTCMGCASMQADELSIRIILGVQGELYEASSTVAWMLCFPFLTLYALGMMQICLQVFLGKVVSFLILCIYVIASGYTKSDLLMGNASMYIRSRLLRIDGIEPDRMAGILIASIICSVMISIYGLRRKDYYGN